MSRIKRSPLITLFSTVTQAWIYLSLGSTAYAKGLDELSEANPANENTAPQPEGTKEKEAVAMEAPSKTSIALRQKLFLRASVNWARILKAEGSWDVDALTDLAVGWKLPFAKAGIDTYATYRYTPLAVSGRINEHEYRGVWEVHYLGVQGTRLATSNIKILGTLETGYALTSLSSLNSLSEDTKHEQNGVSFAFGGGADWLIAEGFAFAAGPRVYASFGKFQSLQIGGAASYLF